MGIVIALLSGALMSVQGVMNTEVTRQSGIWQAAGWVQLSGFAVCVIMWLIQGRPPIGTLWQVEPVYMLSGGILGALITWTVIRSMDSLGPAQAALLIVVSQIVVAYGIELFGLLGMEKADFRWQKAAGALIAAAGIILFERG